VDIVGGGAWGLVVELNMGNVANQLLPLVFGVSSFGSGRVRIRGAGAAMSLIGFAVGIFRLGASMVFLRSI